MLGGSFTRNASAKIKHYDVEKNANNTFNSVPMPVMNFTDQQKENSFTPSFPLYPTPGSSITILSSGSKRKTRDDSSLDSKGPKRQALADKNDSPCTKPYDFAKLGSELNNVTQPNNAPVTRSRNKKPAATFAQNSFDFHFRSNEKTDKPEGTTGFAPFKLVGGGIQAPTPVTFLSTGPSGIGTPTKLNLAPPATDMNQVSENLLKFAEYDATPFFGLVVDGKQAFQVQDNVDDADLPHIKSAYQIWLNDIKDEEVLTQFTSPDALERHREITPLSRWVVLNWIRDVCVEHRMLRQSFHAAVQFLDIFLSNFDFGEDNFQLVAVAALTVALKINDTAQYPIALLVEFMWDEESMTPEQNATQLDLGKRFLLKYEHKLMKLLNWNLMLPTPLDFLRHAFQYAALFEGNSVNNPLPEMLYDCRKEKGFVTVLHQKYDTMLFAQAASMLDRIVVDYDSLSFPGSQLAAAVFWKVYPKKSTDPVYNETLLMTATGYKVEHLDSCLELLDAYPLISAQDITDILFGEMMCELIQKCGAEDNEFKLEEHQIHDIMTPEDYDMILEKRAIKAGKPHIMSHWNY